MVCAMYDVCCGLSCVVLGCLCCSLWDMRVVLYCMCCVVCVVVCVLS